MKNSSRFTIFLRLKRDEIIEYFIDLWAFLILMSIAAFITGIALCALAYYDIITMNTLDIVMCTMRAIGVILISITVIIGIPMWLHSNWKEAGRIRESNND